MYAFSIAAALGGMSIDLPRVPNSIMVQVRLAAAREHFGSRIRRGSREGLFLLRIAEAWSLWQALLLGSVAAETAASGAGRECLSHGMDVFVQ